MVGDTLRMIAGAGCNDPASGLFGRERGDAVKCAALFEAAGHLQVFELEEHPAGRSCGREHFRRREQGVM